MPIAQTAEAPELTDAVCGKRVGLDSKYRLVRGGALFCFCSEACRGLFLVDPSRFAAAAAMPRERPAAQGGPAEGAIGGSLLELAGMRPEDLHDAAFAKRPHAGPARHEALDEAPEGDSGTTTGSAAARPAPVIKAATGSGGLLGSLLAWRERRFAADVCAELLELYRTVAARNPGLAGRDLYLRVMAARNGGDFTSAAALLDGAEQSFAIWPVSRSLKFSDVVHYVAASECLAARGEGRWIQADIKQVVAARIPREL